MKHILAIEDNLDNMSLIEEILEEENEYYLYKAENAEKGINILENHNIDLILMDISLPDMNGLEATRYIKRQKGFVDIPILVLTALAMNSDRDEAIKAGCNAFLTKPIQEDLLLDTIRNLLTLCEPQV